MGAQAAPSELVAAELASGWQGGVYNWVREGISAPMGLLAVWCEFSQTIFYYRRCSDTSAAPSPTHRSAPGQ